MANASTTALSNALTLIDWHASRVKDLQKEKQKYVPPLDTDGKRQCPGEVQTWTLRLVRQETNAPSPCNYR